MFNLKSSFSMAVVFSLTAVFLFSCKSTEDIDANNVDKALIRHKDNTIAQVNKVSPCVTSTGVVKTDSTAFKAKIDDMQRLIQFWKNKPPRSVTDTLTNISDSIKAVYYKSKWVAAEETIKSMNVFIVGLTDDFNNIPPVHDTMPPIIDNRKVDLLKGELADEEAAHQLDNKIAQKNMEAAQKDSHFKNIIMIILMILCLLTGFVIGNKTPFKL